MSPSRTSPHTWDTRLHTFLLHIPYKHGGTPLNGYLSTADTHDITDNSESHDFPSILKQPLNSGHHATPYNVQLSWSKLEATIVNDHD